MKKIGQGFYYNVYDKGEGKVLKVKRSIFRKKITYTLWKIATLYYGKKFNPLPKQLLSDSKENSSSYDLIESLPKSFPRELFANPHFLDSSTYEQDKVIILKEYFKRKSLEERKKVILDYTKLTKKLWTFGISDSTFNFSVNSGLDKNGTVVLVDFNEMDRSLEKVREKIATKFYFKQHSFIMIRDKEFKTLIQEVFEKELSVEELERHWKKKLPLNSLKI